MTEKEQLYNQLYGNLEDFSKVMCPHIFKQDTPKFHKEMYKELQEDADRLCFIVFRGGAKSTLGVTLNLLHRIAYDKEKYIWVIAEGTRQAVERLHDVKYELESNKRFLDLYGNFVTDKWSETEIVVENPHTGHRCKIAALGSKQRMRGGLFEGNRLTLVVLDDFESETNTETEDLRDKLIRWLYATMRPVFDPKEGKILMLGTIVHPDAYLQNIREKPGDWKVIEYAIEKGNSRDGTKPIWGERFNSAWIKREKKDYFDRGRISLFYQEFYNEPVADEERPFKESLLKYHKGEWRKDRGSLVFPEEGLELPVNITIGVDVAMGKKKGDFSAMAAVATDKDNKRYCIKTLNKRIQPYDLIDAMFKWHDEFSSPFGKPRFVIETVAMQELLISWLKREEINRNKFLIKTQVKHRQGKDGENSRFLTMQPLHEAGILFYKPEHEELIAQMLRWGINVQLRNDDLMDSYQMALMQCRPCKRTEVNYEKYKEQKENKTYNWAEL